MTSGECFENKWFYMKYIGKYLSVEILLTRECSNYGNIKKNVGIIITKHIAWHKIFKYNVQVRKFLKNLFARFNLLDIPKSLLNSPYFFSAVKVVDPVDPTLP